MSSMYPSFGGAAVRPCMRCGSPLALNESQCSRCGTFNPLPQGQQFGMPQQGQQGSAWGGQVPQSPQFPQNENGAWPNNAGSSGAWGSTGQEGGWPQNTLFPSPSQPLQQGPFANNGAGFSNQNQSSLNNAFANFQQNPNQSAQNNFFAATQQKGYGTSPLGMMNNPNRRGYRTNDDDEENGKRPSGAVIAVILVLVLALIGGGGFAAYKVFKNNNSTANIIATPAPITTPTGPPLFSDSFKDGTANKWNLNAPTGEKSTIADGKLQLESDNHALFPLILPGKTFADFRLDVDAGLTSGDDVNGYGVYIRVASTQDSALGLYYRFEVYGNGSFVVYKGTADKSGNTQSSNISDVKTSSNNAILPTGQGKLNHLTIIAQGSKLIFIINGTTVSTITDTATPTSPVYKSGSVALFVSEVKSSQAGAQATFENLAVFPAQ